MGYFSEWNERGQLAHRDPSYHGFEEQLIWRREELLARYDDLVRARAPHAGDDRLTDEDYRYAPVQYFKTISDVQTAIEITDDALEDLFSLDEIDNDSHGTANKEKDEDGPSMVEIVYLPSWFESFAAA